MGEYYSGPERREFVRLPYSTPLAYKVCKPETLSKMLAGYTVNVSQAGLLCNLRDEVKVDDIIWLSFDKSILIFCAEIERHMADCGNCRAVVDTLRKTVSLYRTYGHEELPADAKARLYAVLRLPEA